MVSGTALASGQYDVDPAELVDPRSGLFETWYGRQAGEAGRRLCGSFALRGDGPWMAIIEPGRERDATGSWENLLVLEGVTRLTDGDGPATLGVLAGAEYTNGNTRFEFGEARLLCSLIPRDDLVLHANLGVETDRRESTRTAISWGAGAELSFGGPVETVAEVLGDGRSGRPETKPGLRWTAGNDAFNIDPTWATELESGGRREWIAGFGVPFGF